MSILIEEQIFPLFTTESSFHIIISAWRTPGPPLTQGPVPATGSKRCSSKRWWRSNVSATNIPQNRRTDVVYSISSWWRDLSVVTVSFGVPQMCRKPHSSTCMCVLHIYIHSICISNRQRKLGYPWF